MEMAAFCMSPPIPYCAARHLRAPKLAFTASQRMEFNSSRNARLFHLPRSVHSTALHLCVSQPTEASLLSPSSTYVLRRTHALLVNCRSFVGRRTGDSDQVLCR